MRSKLILCLFITSLIIVSCNNNNRKFAIIGNIKGMPQQTVVLQQFSSGVVVSIIDSVHSDMNGYFELTGVSPEPGLYRLQFNARKYILLSIDKGTIHIAGDWNDFINYKVEGSDQSVQLQMFLAGVRQFVTDINSIGRVIDTFKFRRSDSMATVATKEQEDISVKYTQYIEKYADTTSYLPNAIFAAKLLNPKTEATYLEALSQHLAHKFPNAKMSKEFTAYCFNNESKIAKKNIQPMNLQTGMKVPDITVTDFNGKPVSLYSIKGKYTLINFWASYNKGSLSELSYVNAAYQKYKKSNFVVYDISLDNKKEDWEKTIKEYAINFPAEVSDLKGMHSDAAVLYNVTNMPSSFLINDTGMIMAKNLSGDEIGNLLGRVLGY